MLAIFGTPLQSASCQHRSSMRSLAARLLLSSGLLLVVSGCQRTSPPPAADHDPAASPPGPDVTALLDDASPVVRGAAIWALSRLDPQAFTKERERRQPIETDDSVRPEWR